MPPLDLSRWDTLEGRTVIVTGATGFVASHLVPALLEEGAQVFGADVLDDPPLRDAHYHHVECDIRRPADVQNLLAISEPDAVIHLAAQSHVPSAWKNPERTTRINVLGTLHLLRACAELDSPARFLMVSTGDVYGRPDRVPIDESAIPRPPNPYAASKLAAEIFARQMADAGQVPAIIVRPFNHTGPGQSSKFVCAAFAEQIARVELGRQPAILSVGDLTPRRDFLDVRDVVDAYIRALCRGRIGETYNIASGKPRTIQSILETLLECSTANIVVETDPDLMRPSDTPVFAGDASRFRRVTGWRPRIPLEETLEEMLEHFRDLSRES
ncbi:GDP-mannose 4,6-dehydratase [Candidatus Sumerlaeota bacterium]|nr:GDP-mannose 4,6-dehydratase [Candidatus Sumerlaeota bacterium]